MLQINWLYKLDIKTQDDLLTTVKYFKEIKPDYSSIDTETNGLHIIYNKPFLISFGFYNSVTMKGATFTYDFERGNFKNDVMFLVFKICGKTKYCIMHNAKYDMHMLTNIECPYPHKNITDSQIFIRLAHDAIPQRQGGVGLKLKNYAAKYITADAKQFEEELNVEKTAIATKYNNLLVNQFKRFPIPDVKYHPKNTTPKSWTKGVLNNFFKDVLNTPEDLPSVDMTKEYYKWKNSLPKDLQAHLVKNLVDSEDIPYNILNREKVTIYAHYDIVYTLEIFAKTNPIVIQREQQNIVNLENDLIYALYKMERVGFKFNIDYAIESKDKLKAYIISKRERLYELANNNITISQSKVIMEILNTDYELDIESTGNDILDRELTELKQTPEQNKDAIEFIEIVQTLRTLEKWYSTYVIKWLNSVQEDGRVYTTVHQTAAVSGRVSSDFQQFPGEAIKDDNGQELFNPRRMITISGNGYNKIAYIDYSQIELRIQALYTIFVMGGDRNLCRAYMPFECHMKRSEYSPLPKGMIDPLIEEDKFYFDFKDGLHLQKFRQFKWYLNEDPKVEWHPTDLHSKTAMEAFPDIDPNSPEFSKHYRKLGKSTNFACTYGANNKTLAGQFHFPESIANALYNGYRKAYPGVQDYRKYVYQYLMTKPYIASLFGRRYYGANGHKCCNYLIQGSSADFLKKKMVEVVKFLEENNYKTRFQMNIHDEMSFEIYEGEEEVVYKLQAIMQDLPGTVVPIVADIDITETTWDEKKEVAS